MNFGYTSKILVFIICSALCYKYGRYNAEEGYEELNKLNELAASDSSMVYLDILNVLHGGKDCRGLSTYDDECVGRKGVRFIHKKTVNRELIDTVSICTRCVSNKEYDKLNKGFYYIKITDSEKAIISLVDSVFSKDEKNK